MACEQDKLNIVEYLLSDLHLNPNMKNDRELSPLSLAKSKEVIKLLIQHGSNAEDVYIQHRKILGNVFSKDPLKSPVKMFVIGHGGEGKSTLIEAMEHEPTLWSPLVNIFIRPKEVNGVSQRTAGIIPRVFKSRFYGDVLFYDFAGQEAYYSSHAAIIKSAVDTCPPVFLLVIGLHRNETTITYSVSYWLGIITNQCVNMEGKAPLIVVCSHADLVSEVSDVNRKKSIIEKAVNNFISFQLVDIVAIDCRYSNSDGMNLLRRFVGTCCTSIQSKLTVSLNSHMFLIYLLDRYPNKVTITLLQVLSDRRNREHSKKEKEIFQFIPPTILRLIEICKQLSDKGHILFLFDESSPENSHIIIDKAAVLADINGTIFAPNDFKEHCQFATSTGIVPRTKLAKHFNKYSIEMLTKLLSYLELAIPIDDEEVLELIKQHVNSTGESADQCGGKFLFCPALIRLTVLSDVFTYLPTLAYHFGWIITCVEPAHFLNPRFLHVLILRLALTFGFTPQLAVNPDFLALQRGCSVWKTGVCWCTHCGVKVLVEVIDKKQVVVLLQAHKFSAATIELQLSIIQKVKDAVSEFCPRVVTKELLTRPTDVTYPLTTTTWFNFESITHCIVNHHGYIISTSEIVTLPVCDLLPVEVYANLGENILQALFNENNRARVSDRFLSALSSVWNKNPKLVDLVYEAFIQGAETIHRASRVNIELVLKSWRDGSDGTYRSLRHVLDRISIFSGRSPLVSYYTY